MTSGRHRTRCDPSPSPATRISDKMRPPFPGAIPIAARTLAISLLALACTRPAHAQWSKDFLPTPRLALAATTVGDQALFAGGFCNSALDIVEIWDAGSGTWSSALLSQPRLSLAATTVGDKALFAGGTPVLGGPSPSDRVDIYDHASGVWTIAALSQGRRSLVATSVLSQALFAGGVRGGVPGGAITAVVGSQGARSRGRRLHFGRA